jgi:hypothetical protein
MPYARLHPIVNKDRTIEYLWLGDATDKIIIEDALLKFGILDRLPWKLIRQNRVCGGYEFIRGQAETPTSD